MSKFSKAKIRALNDTTETPIRDFASAEYAAPEGAGTLLGPGFYKDVAPPALGRTAPIELM